jgi:hypothetical protein
MTDQELVLQRESRLALIPVDSSPEAEPVSVATAIGTLAHQLDREANLHSAVIFTAVADAAATIAAVGGDDAVVAAVSAVALELDPAVSEH